MPPCRLSKGGFPSENYNHCHFLILPLSQSSYSYLGLYIDMGISIWKYNMFIYTWKYNLGGESERPMIYIHKTDDRVTVKCWQILSPKKLKCSPASRRGVVQPLGGDRCREKGQCCNWNIPMILHLGWNILMILHRSEIFLWYCTWEDVLRIIIEGAGMGYDNCSLTEPFTVPHKLVNTFGLFQANTIIIDFSENLWQQP